MEGYLDGNFKSEFSFNNFREDQKDMDFGSETDPKFYDQFNMKVKHIQNQDLSPTEKKREINKLYCKNNRRKNKEYTKELEQKVEKLEKQVERLTDQLDKYKYKLNIMAIGGEKDYGDFKNYQELGRQELVQRVKTGTNTKFIQNQIRQLGNRAGSAGEDRQKIIKAAFKVIIENIIPERMRILFNIVKHESQATYEDYSQLFKMNQK